ncbi:MAG: hypothetical protein UY35_C0003G0003 [Candidatus Saccharibacteria bacterium GW2011_GWC2_48_9]|nr:MAG: hypothetical protein UY35_C0003G0003 [Candidatus Saccharibacteria bacterium GW2011_GWC2_48_9]HCH34313.1 hypothetical protein [Candidatus Saccharibacteria bacterium]
MEFVETPARAEGELMHVNDLMDADRLEARQRLFLAKKLGSGVMDNIILGAGLDELSQSEHDLAA